MLRTTLLAVSVLACAACTSTGNVERNAAGGAALGALAGAAIGNNVGSGDADGGAVIGGAIGAAAGAYRGCRQDGSCGAQAQAMPPNRREYFDQQRGRYYFLDRPTNRYYYENGQPYP